MQQQVTHYSTSSTATSLSVNNNIDNAPRNPRLHVLSPLPPLPSSSLSSLAKKRSLNEGLIPSSRNASNFHCNFEDVNPNPAICSNPIRSNTSTSASNSVHSSNTSSSSLQISRYNFLANRRSQQLADSSAYQYLS